MQKISRSIHSEPAAQTNPYVRLVIRVSSIRTPSQSDLEFQRFVELCCLNGNRAKPYIVEHEMQKILQTPRLATTTMFCRNYMSDSRDGENVDLIRTYVSDSLHVVFRLSGGFGGPLVSEIVVLFPETHAFNWIDTNHFRNVRELHRLLDEQFSKYGIQCIHPDENYLPDYTIQQVYGVDE